MPTISKMTILVKEASIKNNVMNGSFPLNPRLNALIKKADDDHYSLTLRLQVVNTDDNPFPIDLSGEVVGTFEFVNDTSDEILRFMKREAIQLVYPYLRSVATSLTAIAFVNPLVLPLIDAANIECDIE